jgi:hypothetical protein
MASLTIGMKLGVAGVVVCPGTLGKPWRIARRQPKTCCERKRQPLAAYRFGGLECMLLGPGEGGLMSMIG